MATDHVDIPSRYLVKNPLDGCTAEDLSCWVYPEELIVSDSNKLMWKNGPEWRFLQIYSIRFPNLVRDGLPPIYGRIVLDDTGSIFNRKPGESCHHDIDEKGFVRLSRQHRPIWAEDYVVIYPKVYIGNQPPGQLDTFGKYLSVPSHFKQTCDEVLIEDVKTACGTMQVAYAILSNAADCYVTIKLLQWEGSRASAANIYGKVVASDTLVTDKAAESVVFHREKDEAISVHEGKYIPLQRPCVVVSMGHDLVLDISLFHKNDSPVLIGQLKFRAKCGIAADVNGIDAGSDEESGGNGIYDAKQIDGRHCKFQVKVFWLPCWSHPGW